MFLRVTVYHYLVIVSTLNDFYLLQYQVFSSIENRIAQSATALENMKWYRDKIWLKYVLQLVNVNSFTIIESLLTIFDGMKVFVISVSKTVAYIIQYNSVI